MRRVTHTLEELNSLLPLKLLQLAILLDEVLFIHRQFHPLEVVQDQLLGVSVSRSRY